MIGGGGEGLARKLGQRVDLGNMGEAFSTSKAHIFIINWVIIAAIPVHPLSHPNPSSNSRQPAESTLSTF